MRRVLATAGHVDHGKSTLVRALTGRDPAAAADEQVFLTRAVAARAALLAPAS